MLSARRDEDFDQTVSIGLSLDDLAVHHQDIRLIFPRLLVLENAEAKLRGRTLPDKAVLPVSGPRFLFHRLFRNVDLVARHQDIGVLAKATEGCVVRVKPESLPKESVPVRDAGSALGRSYSMSAA